VNGGQVIKLRLRRAGDGSFLHYESVRAAATVQLGVPGRASPRGAPLPAAAPQKCLHRHKHSIPLGLAPWAACSGAVRGPDVRARRCAQVLGTMLHELCHNEHGPHNAAFYKLLDEITAVRRAAGPRRPHARAFACA
jgi:hypothetical protein